METLRIKGQDLHVDYHEELSPFIPEWNRVEYKGIKLQCCSPFRNERHPSFAVNLENGLWVDSGAPDESLRKGNFISLLANLRGEDYEDTMDYLFETYGKMFDDVSGLKLSINLNPIEMVVHQDKFADVCGKVSDYLTGRGIADFTQIKYQTGIGKNGDCIAIPWHDKNGRIINVKYRSTNTKDFWYSKGGEPVKNHVYGLFIVREERGKQVWIVESEIDALYLASFGFYAVALGGSSISETQINLIKSTDIDELVIATDNDAVGHRVAGVLANEFCGYMNVKRLKFPEGVKDVNEMTASQLNEAIIEEVGVSLNLLV